MIKIRKTWSSHFDQIPYVRTWNKSRYMCFSITCLFTSALHLTVTLEWYSWSLGAVHAQHIFFENRHLQLMYQRERRETCRIMTTEIKSKWTFGYFYWFQNKVSHESPVFRAWSLHDWSWHYNKSWLQLQTEVSLRCGVWLCLFPHLIICWVLLMTEVDEVFYLSVESWNTFL